MTNYQMIIQINDKTRAKIEKIQENNKMEKWKGGAKGCSGSMRLAMKK